MTRTAAALILLTAGMAFGDEANVHAFPGAEGFGAVSVGGRGGRVIKVTNLDAKGPGSLQAACEAEGPRVVVFEVSGVIRGTVVIKNPFITLAGQTAPGAGITIEGMLQTAYKRPLHDITVRHLRVRPRHRPGVSGDAVQFGHSKRFILDHCSMSWAVDETIDTIFSREFTVQWCTIEESDATGHAKGRKHNYGFINAYPGSGAVSLHHNLFAHHYRRCPSLSPYAENSPGDVRNNVLYDCYACLTHDGHHKRIKSPINVIGNWYRKGPSHDLLYMFELYPNTSIHISGNYIHGIGYIKDPRDLSQEFPSWIQVGRTGVKRDEPAKVPPVTTQTAEEACKLVLAQAGCFPRDRVTRRTVKEVAAGTGKWGRNAPAEPTDEWFLEGLNVGQPSADTDNDGMPDDWEKAHGLNPEDAADATKVVPAGASKDDRHKGYTYIEFYINELAGDLMAKAAKSDTDPPPER